MPQYVRTYQYKLDHGVNAGKLRALDALYAEWQRVLPAFNKALMLQWQLDGKLPRALNYNQLPYTVATSLPTNTQTAMLHAVIGQHASWNANVANRFAKTIAQLDGTLLARLLQNHGLLAEHANAEKQAIACKAFTHQLFWINRCAAWFLPYAKQCELLKHAQESGKGQPPTELSVLASRLARRYIQAYCKRFKRPDVTNLPLALTQLTGLLDAPVKRKRTKAKTFPHWLRLSTLTAGQRIELPLRANPYADAQRNKRSGTVAKSMTLLRKNGTYYLCVYHQYQSGDNTSRHVLAMDLGMNNLIATSDGDIEGVHFLSKLKRYDFDLQRIIKGLQQAGIVRYGQCKRYRKKLQQLRGFIKTTVDTAVKRIILRRKPALLLTESLSFKNSALSKRMNRLLHHFGQGQFEKALRKYEEEQQFKIEKIPAAYTSQGCPSCFFVSPKNRKGNQFQCLVCGRKRHADVNAAQHLLKRFQQGDLLTRMKYQPHTQWWSVLFRQHVETINSLPFSNTRVIGCAKSAISHLPLVKQQQLKAWLTHRNLSRYETALFNEMEKQAATVSTT